MFAIIETGGKQYKVSNGMLLNVEKLEEAEGATINIDKVLMISANGSTKIGTPLLSGAFVVTKVVAQKKDDKILIFKKKSKKRYQKTQGHRQAITTLEIVEIHAEGGKATKSTVKAEEKVEPKAEKVEATTAEKPKAAKKPAAKAKKTEA